MELPKIDSSNVAPFEVKPQPGPQLFLVTCPYQDIFFGGQRGGGKAQTLDSVVHTPFGPKRMGDIKLGDQVCNPEGGIANVIAIHPQPKQQIYKVTMADGATTRVTGGHIWLSRIVGQKLKAKRRWMHVSRYLYEGRDYLNWKLFTTLQLKEWIAKGPASHNSRLPVLPLPQPLTYTVSGRNPAKIDPYILGLIIGDGHCGDTGIGITSADKEIGDMLLQLGFVENRKPGNAASTYLARGEIFQTLRTALQQLDLYGCKSNSKFIPRQFLYGSIENRWELLRGLMDSDGSATPEGKLNYSSVSKRLADEVRTLIEGLGGWATIWEKPGKYRNEEGEIVECQISYNLYIKLQDHSQAFRLKRKKERAAKYSFNGGADQWRKIVSIEEDGFEEAQCITVDHPNGLYLTDNCIVTHNSFAVLLDFIYHAAKYGEHAVGLIVRESYKELQDFNEKKAMPILFRLGWDWNVGRQTWYAPNGATLRMGHMATQKDANKLLGAELTWFAVEEIGNFPNDNIDKPEPGSNVGLDMIRGSMRSAHGVPVRFLCTGNPGGIGHRWIKARYVDPAPPMTPFKDEETGQWRVFIPSSTKDNPILMESDPEYVDRLRAVGSKALQKAWIEGDWEISLKGEIFERQWFGWYDWNPEDAIMPRIGIGSKCPPIHGRFSSWDTGCKVEEVHSKTAGLTWATSVNEIFILDMFNKRVQFPVLVDTVKMSSRKWRPEAIWVEERSSGIQLVQTLRTGTQLPIKPVQVTRDKESRAHAVSAGLTTGKVLLPSKCPWAYDLLEELCAYPQKGESDLVDAFTLGMSQISYSEERIKKFRNSAGYRNRSIYGR